MGNYQRGLYVGADTVNHPVTAPLLKAKAITAEALATTPNNVVAVSWDGTTTKTFPFSSRSDASGKYDEIASNPRNVDGVGEVGYVAVFDRADPVDTTLGRQPYDEAFFVATSQSHAHTRSQSAAGWVAALFASLFGLMAFGRKRSS